MLGEPLLHHWIGNQGGYSVIVVHRVRFEKISKWSRVSVLAILAPFSYRIDQVNL
jgi:hypothetical protein